MFRKKYKDTVVLEVLNLAFRVQQWCDSWQFFSSVLWDCWLGNRKGIWRANLLGYGM